MAICRIALSKLRSDADLKYLLIGSKPRSLWIAVVVGILLITATCQLSSSLKLDRRYSITVSILVLNNTNIDTLFM